MPFLEPLPASTSHVSMRGRVQVCFWLACAFVCDGMCGLPVPLVSTCLLVFVTVGLVCWARPARAIFCLSVGAVFFDLNRSVLDRSVCGTFLEFMSLLLSGGGSVGGVICVG